MWSAQEELLDALTLAEVLDDVVGSTFAAAPSADEAATQVLAHYQSTPRSPEHSSAVMVTVPQWMQYSTMPESS